MAVELVRVERINKSFAGVSALKDVHFDLRSGEVHALLGENGAGKSTLMKIISGVYSRDSGALTINGAKIAGNLTPHSAQALGVGIIHQELNLCPHLTVAENIFLNRECTSGPFLDKKRQNEEAKKYLKTLNMDIEPHVLTRELPVSKRQMVEICKTLSMNANIIIMDEPTSALTEKEIEDLFKVISMLKAEGKGIIYISHRLEELSRIVDRLTIMRDGQYITTLNFTETNLDEIISLMVGRTLTEKFPRIETHRGEKILEVKNLSDSRGPGLKNVSFDLYRGEILAFAGLMGAGRTELVRAVSGAVRASAGEIILNGKTVRVRTPQDAIKHGIFCAPEDRKLDGLCVKMTVKENITLPSLDLVARWGVVSPKIEQEKAKAMVGSLKIKTPGIEQYVRNLSGGNQQKIVVGKWLMRDAKVVIFDEPTRGIDVASKIEIYTIINDLKRSGIGVMFVSSELPEVLGMADRIIVMCNGRITANLDARKTNQEEILRYATRYNMADEAENSVEESNNGGF
ncbi:MAG: sugar ABC transporter ATP-binding protein [Spirochaetaceae bacterium]|jgi:ribose transport system ATP-binding protein|nr:sugar ABC transporter ATP-binding protein [Spirochaetaceae bacterium]